MHIELVHFFCCDCGLEIFIDSKTAIKRKNQTGKYLCDKCFRKFRLKGEKHD